MTEFITMKASWGVAASSSEAKPSIITNLQQTVCLPFVLDVVETPTRRSSSISGILKRPFQWSIQSARADGQSRAPKNNKHDGRRDG